MVASVPHSPECFRGAKPLIYRWDINAEIGQKPALSCANPATSCLVSTVMNMWNGRYACSYRPLRTCGTTVTRQFFNGFARFFCPYYPILTLILPNSYLDIARLSACYCFFGAWKHNLPVRNSNVIISHLDSSQSGSGI